MKIGELFILSMVIMLLCTIAVHALCAAVVILLSTAMFMAYVWRRVSSHLNGFKALSIFIHILIVIAIAIPVVHYVIDPSFIPSLTLEKLGNIAEYCGGVIGTLIAAIVAIYAIRTYKEEREYQKEEAVSARLSTMLDLHKQNVNEINVMYYKTSSTKHKGRKAFEVFVNELAEIYDVVETAVNNIIDHEPEVYKDFASEIRRKKVAHAISYGYFFYSVDTYVLTDVGGDALFMLNGEVREIARQKLSKHLQNLQHHITLGHYFRHLYNMVNYIDANTFTNDYNKKVFYVKLIRSQLSDYEQILLYYNALSTLGFDWNKDLGKQDIQDMNLICKYRLVKNCPLYLDYFGIHPTELYKMEDEAWKTKGDLLFETDSKGQEVTLKEMMKDPKK